MTFAVLLLLLGGFLLGGAWSIWKADSSTLGRTGPQVAFAVVLLLAALLAHDVLVRDVGIPGWLRVTAGTAAETDAFLTALGEVAPDHRLGD